MSEDPLKKEESDEPASAEAGLLGAVDILENNSSYKCFAETIGENLYFRLIQHSRYSRISIENFASTFIEYMSKDENRDKSIVFAYEPRALDFDIRLLKDLIFGLVSSNFREFFNYLGKNKVQVIVVNSSQIESSSIYGPMRALVKLIAGLSSRIPGIIDANGEEESRELAIDIFEGKIDI